MVIIGDTYDVVVSGGLVIVALLFGGGAAAQAQTLPEPVTTAADALCENALAEEGMCDVAWALSALWLNRETGEANRRLQEAYNAFLDGAPEMTPEIAYTQAKWQMRTWVRIYYLFNDRSAWFPGRLESETQNAI